MPDHGQAARPCMGHRREYPPPPTPSSLEQGTGNSFGLQTALIPFSQMHEAKDIKTKKKKDIKTGNLQL